MPTRYQHPPRSPGQTNSSLCAAGQIWRCSQIINAGDWNYVARQEGLKQYLEVYVFMQDRRIQTLELQLASKIASRDVGRKFLEWEERGVLRKET